MKVLTVTGYKGGVGKSTTALHLAAFLNERGSTILVDGDPNRSLLSWAARGGSLPFEVVDERSMMKRAVGADYVIVDTPARPDSSDLKELATGCDLLILPTRPEIMSVEPMMETISHAGTENYRALITMVPPYPVKAGEEMRAELREAGYKVFDATIRNAVAFDKAALQGVTVRDLDSRSRIAWNDIERFGKEVLANL